MERKIIQVQEKVPVNLLIPLSIQHMFAMFGASVLVPFMFGINPAIVLLMNGVGTLTVYFDHKGKGTGIPWIKFCISVARNSGYARNSDISMHWADL